MILSLDVERLRTPEQVRAFLDGSEPVDFNPVSRDEAYAFVSRTLTRFDYARLGKPDRCLVKGFLGKATGLSRAQLTRLVRPFAKTGQVVDRRGGAPRRPFERRYTAADIRLLAEVDATLGQMAGPATREVMRREFEVCGDGRFARLAHISIGHLYNLRKSTTDLRKRTVPDRTRPTRVAVGAPRKSRRSSAAAEPRSERGAVTIPAHSVGSPRGCQGVAFSNEKMSLNKAGACAEGLAGLDVLRCHSVGVAARHRSWSGRHRSWSGRSWARLLERGTSPP